MEEWLTSSRREMTDFFDRMEAFIFREDAPERADVIFIPGSPEPDQARLAAKLFREGYAPLVLPSGRYAEGRTAFQAGESVSRTYPEAFATEWEFLREVLFREGVPGEAILREDQARYTWQNASLSRQVTDETGLTVRRAILCCKTWHARRCLLYYQTAFPGTRFFVCCASPDGITRENWRASESGIRTVTEEMGRILVQFSLMMAP